MKPKTRQLIILAHVVLAGFFLPMALVYSVTGGLYTFGITGSYDTQTAEVPMTVSESPTLDEVTLLAEEHLKSQQIVDRPTGKLSLKKMGTSWQMEWTGSNFDFTIEPTRAAGVFKASIKKTTWHRFFVQLHKAKGGFPFKVLAGGLALCFILLFASGVAMAFTSPKLKKNLYLSFALGLVTFIILAGIS